MENPRGKAEGFGRVGIGVQVMLPLAYPYPCGG
jgi:hypothetical protein